MKKRGQVTIFIILGIIIVVGVVFVILYLTGKVPSLGKTSPSNPESFLSTCLQDTLRQDINDTAFRGGNGDLKNAFVFQGRKTSLDVSYLCYTEKDDGTSCTNLYILIPYFERSVEVNIKNDVKNCYDDLISSLENQNTVTENYKGFNVSIQPNRVAVDINASITTTRKGSDSGTQTYQNFKIEVPSSIYGVLQTANDITNKVATGCTFSTGYLVNYPNYDINKYSTTSESVIYTVTDRTSGDQFNFATRGCIMEAI